MEEANTLELTNVRDAVIEVCSGELNHAAFQKIAAAAFGTEEGREEVAQLLASWETFAKNIPSKEVASIVQGYFLLTLGDGAAAEEVLRSVKRQPWGAYHLARALEARNRVAEALAVAEEALEAESGSLDLKYLVVDLYLKMRRTDEAGKILDKLQKAEGQSPQYQYHRGCYLESTGDYEGAIQCYREAVNIDGNHADALFRLGFLLDIHGTDADDANDEALSSFENCVRINPVHTNAVVNLGVLYEDRERYHDAIKCYETVLRILPNHERARLYLGDAQAATQMFYDKEQEKKADKQSQVLKIPVSDFELSVRSRNCLQKMNIQTLGDLILKTEQELLSYKNFGETSLAEIKEMLSQKGLRLGQAVEGKSGEPVAGRNPLEATASQEVLGKPIEELNLSVRSRRCMERLEVRSIRDLINKTEMELMAAKNFGMTSLNEIKRKLGDLGLSLRS